MVSSKGSMTSRIELFNPQSPRPLPPPVPNPPASILLELELDLSVSMVLWSAETLLAVSE